MNKKRIKILPFKPFEGDFVTKNVVCGDKEVRGPGYIPKPNSGHSME